MTCHARHQEHEGLDEAQFSVALPPGHYYIRVQKERGSVRHQPGGIHDVVLTYSRGNSVCGGQGEAWSAPVSGVRSCSDTTSNHFCSRVPFHSLLPGQETVYVGLNGMNLSLVPEFEH